MRVLKRILSWTIWSVIALHVLVLFSVQLPPVQAWMGQRVSAMLSETLGTRATVGRVGAGLPGRFIVDDVQILDQAGDPLLSASRLAVKIELLPLLNGRIAIASAQLFGADIRLNKADDTTPANYQFVIDALSSSDSTSNSSLDLRINSLILRRTSVSYDRGDVFTTPGQLNASHLKISNISTHLVLKALTKDSLNLNLKRLAFDEQSGLKVDRFAARLEANGSKALLSELRLQLPQTSIGIDSVWATYDRDQIEATLSYGGTINDTRFVPADFAPILPALNELSTAFHIDGAFTGTTKSMAWQQLNINADDGSILLNAKGDWDGSQKRAAWNTRIEDFYISNGLVQQLCNLFPDIPTEITRLGHISMRGEAYQQTDGNTEAATIINTDLGQAIMMVAVDESERLSGRIDTDSLHIGHLLDNDKLGFIATHINLSGKKDSIGITGRVERLGYNGYTYQNVNLDGTYNPQAKTMAGHIDIDDPNLTANVEGQYGQAIRITGFVENLNLDALNLTDRWPGTSFAAVVDADFTGTSFNDVQGSIDLDDFVMKDTGNDSILYHLDNLHLKSDFDEGRHFLRINGDMGEAELATWSEGNSFDIRMQLDDTDWMQPLVGVPLQLYAPLHLTATVDNETHQIDVNSSLPAFSYAGIRCDDMRLKLNTEKDTTHCNAALTMRMSNGGTMKLNLDADTRLFTNDQGKTEAHIHVNPSQMLLKGTPWNIDSCDIHYSDRRIAVDSFTVAHGRQHLIIDGVASAMPHDSLVVDLNDMEVDYILDLVNFHAVRFSGLATGKAYATQVFPVHSSQSTDHSSQPTAWADLVVKDFHFLEGEMGTLHAKANWNKTDKQIDIDAVIDDSPDDTALHANSVSVTSPKTYINGYVSPVRSDIRLDIRAKGTSVDFCRSFTSSFLSDLKGRAYGHVKVAGPLKHINLTGAAAVNGEATVTALGTTYQLRGDTIRFVPNDIVLDRFSIYDRDNHQATISGGIHHNELSNFTFDLDIDADRLLAYNFTEFNGSIICGNVYATGTADLHGRPGEVVINCNVTPQPSSFFAYNAANPDAISKQEFITWEKSPSPSSPTPDPSRGGDASGGTDIHINFLINATPEATLRVLMDQNTGDYIALNGNGTIRATFYNKGPFSMFGTYNVDHGTYGITIQNIIKKNFTFQPGGTIVFGGDPFNANLNLQALYTVNGVSLSDLNIGNSFANNTVRVNCLMNIMGTPGQPRVEFDLDMPTVNSEENQMIRSVIASEQEMNQQVLYLLGIGRFYTQGVNNAGSQQYDQTTLAMQSFLSGTVSTQINEVLSQIIKSNDWNFGANISTGNEGWHNAEYEGLVSGRMLNNRLLINGQFGYRDNATQTTPSFIGDFDIRYLLNRNGNLAVKVYNQTNDRYFTRSSLNTQGVGLIMKRDFDNLSDLFHWRKRKTNR